MLDGIRQETLGENEHDQHRQNRADVELQRDRQDLGNGEPCRILDLGPLGDVGRNHTHRLARSIGQLHSVRQHQAHDKGGHIAHNDAQQNGRHRGEALKGMLEEDPKEILEEPDRYITAYEEKHQDSLTVMDLAGIGRYWLARLQNRDTDANREACRNVASLLGKKIKEKGMSGDISLAAYALEVMQGAGSDIKNLLCEFEKHANRVDCTDTERAYTSYRLFRLSHDDFYIMKTREELKNLRPELLTLDDALMLAEVLSYTINTQNTTRL